MLLEIAAGVLIGNTVSMGAIAGVNLWLERKADKLRTKNLNEFLLNMASKETEVDQMITEAVASKTANKKRTVRP